MGMSQNPTQIIVTDKGSYSLFIFNTADAIYVDIDNSQMSIMSAKNDIGII